MDRNTKSIEQKKDEFTAYLERYGVVVKINEVLRKLYEGSIDKNNPIKNPIDYLKKELIESQQEKPKHTIQCFDGCKRCGVCK
jgi:hypothetical protein